MANYSKTRIAGGNRIELHDALSLTGAEISINSYFVRIFHCRTCAEQFIVSCLSSLF